VTPSARDLRDARALREAIYGLAVACCDGEPLPARDRALVNEWAALPPPVPQLDRGDGVTWSVRGVRSLLAGIAREAVLLFGGGQASRIRQCSGHGCALLFLDTSRSGKRRWCSMAGCGNKAKVAKFRANR
jgi:predicted RNA-binding Zn ribbon-like protein